MDATAWIIFAVIMVVAIGCFVYGIVRSLRTWPPAKVEAKSSIQTLPKAA